MAHRAIVALSQINATWKPGKNDPELTCLYKYLGV